MIFKLTPEQERLYAEWHAKLPPVPLTAAGGRISFSFTPTSIGTIVQVTDSATGHTMDLTDYENW